MKISKHCWKKNSGTQRARTSDLWITCLPLSLLSWKYIVPGKVYGPCHLRTNWIPDVNLSNILTRTGNRWEKREWRAIDKSQAFRNLTWRTLKTTHSFKGHCLWKQVPEECHEYLVICLLAWIIVHCITWSCLFSQVYPISCWEWDQLKLGPTWFYIARYAIDAMKSTQTHSNVQTLRKVIQLHSVER